MAAIATRMTPEEFLLSPEAETCELIDGVPREKDMGARSALVGGEIEFDLRTFARQSGTGVVFPGDAGFALWPDRPNHVRKPDVSYVSFERLGGRIVPEGWLTVPPELAIEVISPNERSRETQGKLDDLLGAGVDLVWVVHPDAALTYVYRQDGTVHRVPASEPLDASPVLPGFTLRLADILDLLPAATAD